MWIQWQIHIGPQFSLRCILCLVVFIGIVCMIYLFYCIFFYFSSGSQLNQYQLITTTQKNKRTSSNQHGNGSNISSNSKASAVSSTSSTSSKKTPITNIAIRSPPLPLPLPHQVQSVSSTIQYPNMNTLGMFAISLSFVCPPKCTLCKTLIHLLLFMLRLMRWVGSQYVPVNSNVTTTPSKHNKLPQQILPKPSISNISSTVITQPKYTTPVTIAQSESPIAQSPNHHMQQSNITTQPQPPQQQSIVTTGQHWLRIKCSIDYYRRNMKCITNYYFPIFEWKFVFM